MHSDRSFCPQCQKEVVFMKTSDCATCPLCGFKFEISAPMIEVSEPSELMFGAMSILKVLLFVFIAAVGLVGIGLGVLYVGCG